MREKITLNTICEGEAMKCFEQQLPDVLKNIRDPNTHIEKPRKLLLEFEFRPLTDRNGAVVTVCAKLKLAPPHPKGTIIKIQSSGTQLDAFAGTPGDIPPEPKSTTAKSKSDHPVHFPLTN